MGKYCEGDTHCLSLPPCDKHAVPLLRSIVSGVGQPMGGGRPELGARDSRQPAGEFGNALFIRHFPRGA